MLALLDPAAVDALLPASAVPDSEAGWEENPASPTTTFTMSQDRPGHPVPVGEVTRTVTADRVCVTAIRGDARALKGERYLNALREGTGRTSARTRSVTS